MSSSLPDGYTIRPATPGDAEPVNELIRAAELAVRGRTQMTVQDVRSWWRLVELPTDSWLIDEGGTLAAAAMLIAHGDVPDLWAVVSPTHVGRGLGSALVATGEARALERGAGALRAGAYAEDARAGELLSARGYRDVRHYFTMVIRLDEAPPRPEWPPGIDVEPFRVDQARAFHAAHQDAFADEWGFVPMEFDEWYRLRVEDEDGDTGLWFLVRDGEEVVAVVRNDPHRYGGGWVGAIGVRAPWRRRGIGLALLMHSFGAFYARGTKEVRLGVDTQNSTGATRLYERAGMSVEQEDVVYERALP